MTGNRQYNQIRLMELAHNGRAIKQENVGADSGFTARTSKMTVVFQLSGQEVDDDTTNIKIPAVVNMIVDHSTKSFDRKLFSYCLCRVSKK